MVDPRAGAKAILDAIAQRRFENRSEGQRVRKLLRYENALWATGALHVAGVDEAGMSPLAGPVSAAAVVFAPGARIPGIDNSKKLDAATRDRTSLRRSSRRLRLGLLDLPKLRRSTRSTSTGPVFWQCVARSKD